MRLRHIGSGVAKSRNEEAWSRGRVERQGAAGRSWVLFFYYSFKNRRSKSLQNKQLGLRLSAPCALFLPCPAKAAVSRMSPELAER